MVTIPNQSSVAKAWQEFDESGRMKPSPYYDRVVDVMEELVKFTLLIRDKSAHLTDRYSERKGDLVSQALANASGAVETVPVASAVVNASIESKPVRSCCTTASGSC